MEGAWHPSLFLFPIRRVTCTGLMMSFLMANEYRTSSTLKTKTGIINTFGRIRNLWSLNKVLEYEPLIDETLNKLLAKIDSKFVQEGKACPADEWMSYCRRMIYLCPSLLLSNKRNFRHQFIDNCVFSCVGRHRKYHFRSPLWVYRPRERCR